MKKLFFVLLLSFLGSTLSGVAQDLIVKIDATHIKAKVEEITSDAVRYKRFSNPDGPTYVLPIAEIDYICYANGEIDRFKKSASAKTPTPVTEKQSAPASQPTTPAEQKTTSTPPQTPATGGICFAPV